MTNPLAPAPLEAAGPGRTRTSTVLDVVVPVYNEEADLERCVRRLHHFLATEFPYCSRITVADNASTDRTLEIARALEAEFDDVRAVHLDLKGRGRALHAVWESSDAIVLAYTDVDLSTDLNALLPLVAPLLSGHSDVAIGCRLAPTSHVVRGPKREIISRCYNLLLRTTMGLRVRDAQCGFKAIRADVARRLLPLVQDTGWFFDTELLILAERAGLRIYEVPVDWADDPDSRVDIVSTARADIAGMVRVGRALARGDIPLATIRDTFSRDGVGATPGVPGVPSAMLGQLIRFAVVGVASTAAYALLYVALRGAIGAQASNFTALLVTAVLNTAVNRRLTFGVRGRSDMYRHHAQGLAVFAFGWALTAAALAVLHFLAPGTSHLAELTVLVAANLVATALRFVILRRLFRPATASTEVAR